MIHKDSVSEGVEYFYFTLKILLILYILKTPAIKFHFTGTNSEQIPSIACFWNKKHLLRM